LPSRFLIGLDLLFLMLKEFSSPGCIKKQNAPVCTGHFAFLKSDFRLELVPQDADVAPYSLSCTLILSHGLASNWLRDVIDRLQNA
jgi:hypothetical protein